MPLFTPVIHKQMLNTKKNNETYMVIFWTELPILRSNAILLFMEASLFHSNVQ